MLKLMYNQHIVITSISWMLVSIMLIVSTIHISNALPASGGGPHKVCAPPPGSYGPFDCLLCETTGGDHPTYSNCEKCTGDLDHCVPTTDTPTQGKPVPTGNPIFQGNHLPTNGGIFQNMPSNPGTSGGNSHGNINGGVFQNTPMNP
jgi:hypothetical protein